MIPSRTLHPAPACTPASTPALTSMTTYSTTSQEIIKPNVASLTSPNNLNGERITGYKGLQIEVELENYDNSIPTTMEFIELGK